MRRSLLTYGVIVGLGGPWLGLTGCGTLGGKSPALRLDKNSVPVAAGTVANDSANNSIEKPQGPLLASTQPSNRFSNTETKAEKLVAQSVTVVRSIGDQEVPVTQDPVVREGVSTVAYEAPVVVSPSDVPAHHIRLEQPSVSFETVECPSPPLEITNCGTECSGCGNANCCATSGQLPPNSNEYIFDGGDQEPTVVVRKDWSAVGIDPSDTVIYYETLGGKVCVTPSNRVPIYAPRFGAVRQVTGAVLAARAVGTERMLAPVAAAGFRETDLAGNVSMPLAPHGEQQVGMLDAFQENRSGVPIAQVIPPMRVSDALVMCENITFFTTGEMLDHEIPVLGRVLANAREWYTPESVEVVIDGQQAALVVDAKRAQDVHVYEMPDKCAMRICKAASHTIANSGDIVRFTIRFDNVGPKPLGNAVVMDSLSARLEYIEDSQQCSVDARFSTDANDVGSQLLRWEIEEAIQPSNGGVISFDCRVR